MTRASGAVGASPRRTSPPRMFEWDFVTHPVNIFDSGGRFYKTDLDPQSKVAPGIWNGPKYWVAHHGSNDNSGLARTSPLASAWKARQLAEGDPAAANGYSINFIPDPATGLLFLDQAHDLNNTAATVKEGASRISNRPFALICHGGRLVMGPIQQLAFALVDEASNVWVAETSGSIVAALFNIADPGPFGVQSRIAKIVTGFNDDSSAIAAVASAPGDAWVQAQGSSKLYVRLASGRSATKTTVLAAGPGSGLRLGAGDVYVSGVELIGGTAGGGAFDTSGVAPRTLVFEDVGARGQGAMEGLAQPSFGIDGLTGLAIFHRCYGYNSLGSIFDLRSAGGPVHALMIDCWGVDAGFPGAKPPSYANQIVSVGHDAKLISLNTKGSYSAGGCVGGYGNSQHWDLGSIYAYDRGDLWMGSGGVIPPTGVRLEGGSRYWGQDVTVGGCAVSFHASSKDAELFLRDPVEIGGKRAGTGKIGEF